MYSLKLIFLYFVIFIFTILISKKLKLYDKPNVRKIHTIRVYNTGGVILYFYFLGVVALYELNHSVELIVSIGFFVFILGFIDDRINLSPFIKIAFIIFPSLYLILQGLSINNLGIYEQIGLISLGKFQVPFLILSLGLIINATNYIDGTDGLLLTFFISCLTYYALLIDDYKTISLIKILIFPLIINLILNFIPSKKGLKFFSGNAGSYFIGFFIGFLTIIIYNEFNIHPVYLIWPLWYPVYDFLFVSLNRIIKKKSIFFADNSHLHHKILNYFRKNHIKTLFLFFFLNSIVIYLGYLISNYSKILSLISFIIVFPAYYALRLKYK